ncbi:hypothetical protein AcW1_006521 [Taiwanofungus camphoratus]|nr:hypothetical protein AcV5_009108 [Antrodia cinnamomea]KAI0924394.1 hypothetical protein AcW2_005282 [Antrodia cinnamomea]KAI0940761.1 hypothetical protein AcV7_003055 [Antrodia cinnamomea]KAI0954724.1 hypothetical protein AcW1_006521 [Antrodia cinnamomea]
MNIPPVNARETFCRMFAKQAELNKDALNEPILHGAGCVVLEADATGQGPLGRGGPSACMDLPFLIYKMDVLRPIYPISSWREKFRRDLESWDNGAEAKYLIERAARVIPGSARNPRFFDEGE